MLNTNAVNQQEQEAMSSRTVHRSQVNHVRVDGEGRQ